MGWNRRNAAFGWGHRAGRYRGIGGGAASYDPSSEAGYLLDFFAEAGITEAGTGVASWVDQASGVDVVQATDANRPAYQAAGLGGKPSVLFESSNNDGLAIATFANAATSWTIYAFLDQKSAAAGSHYALDSQTGRMAIACRYAATGAVGYFDNVAWRSATATTTGAQVLTWSLDAAGTAGTIYRGSTAIGSGLVYSPVAMGAQFVVGNSIAANAALDAAVGRLLVFAALHDAATRARVWAWGAAHYGVAV